MANVQLNRTLRHLQAWGDAQALAEASDAQLLERFTDRHEEAAFTALLRRHGAMVWSVSRRVLRCPQDAEDVFQATFLLLARKAASIRKRTAVASWLHGVAHRLALKAKAQGARRQARERQAAERCTPPLTSEAAWRRVQEALDNALAELPEKYRSALVLCCLEGKTLQEAARQLGCPPATVGTWVARGRALLGRRLAHRGLTLSTAGLAALLLASAAPAAAPPTLVKATVKAARSLGAGQAADTLCSAQVAGLVNGGLPTMFLTRGKALTALLLAVVLAGAGVLTHQSLAANEDPEPKQAAKGDAQPPAAAKEGARPPAKAAPDEAAGDVTFAGRVLDPDGKPFAGARLYVLYYTPRALPIPVRGRSDADGRFRLTVHKTDFDRSGYDKPWDQATVVAQADGFGLGMHRYEIDKPAPPTQLTLRLVRDDYRAAGRVLDLQGRPIAGVTVSVHGLHAAREGDLTAFLQGVKQKQEMYLPLRENTLGFEGDWIGRDVGTLFPRAVTDADGRFRITGVGRERVVALRVEGPTIETRDVLAMTRAAGRVMAPGYRQGGDYDELLTLTGCPFDHAAAPCKPVVGVVRDKDTGKPIPGAVVQSYQFAGSRVVERTHLRTVADPEGRYRFPGLPKGEGNVLRASPPEGQPYLMALHTLQDTPGLEPITADFALKRGVWIQGKVTDKATGRPVHAMIGYSVFEDNPHRGEAPGLTVDAYLQTNAGDGTFRLVGLPGRGLVGARAWGDRYRLAVGADKVKGLEENGHFRTYPHLIFSRNYHTLIEVSPAAGADTFTCEVVLDPGLIRTGTVLGPGGKPLAGARVSGVNSYGYWEHEPLKTAEFTLTGLEAGQPRLVQVAHLDKQLAGSVVVRAEDKGAITVRLGPAATLTGRLVTPEGQPVSDGEILAMRSPPMAQPGTPKPDLGVGSFPDQHIRPGKDGTFRIDGLAPGLKYQLGLHKGIYLHSLGGAAEGQLTVRPGETKNLGDVPVKPIE
jgi:RNA polymerase sigma factor (sigma-70 family)